MWALLKQARVPRLRPTAQRPSGPNAHLPGSLVGPVLIFHRYWRERRTTMFESIWFNLPFLSFQSLPIYAFVCLQNQTLHIREDAHSLFSNHSLKGKTSQIMRILFCIVQNDMSVCIRPVHLQELNTKRKEYSETKLSSHQIDKNWDGIQPSENWVMSTFSGQKPFTTIIWTIPPYFLTFFKAWLWT